MKSSIRYRVLVDGNETPPDNWQPLSKAIEQALENIRKEMEKK